MTFLSAAVLLRREEGCSGLIAAFGALGPDRPGPLLLTVLVGAVLGQLPRLEEGCSLTVTSLLA